MTPDQFEKLQETISTQIKLTVNGKIDKLQLSVEKTQNNLDNYIKQDNSWKEEVKPYIENMRMVSNFTSVGSALLKFIMILGGAGGVLYGLIKYLK